MISVVSDSYVALSEEQLFKKLKISRKHFEEGKYKNADEVISGMRTKYGI